MAYQWASGTGRVVGRISGGARWQCHEQPDGCTPAPLRTCLGSGWLVCAVPAVTVQSGVPPSQLQEARGSSDGQLGRQLVRESAHSTFWADSRDIRGSGDDDKAASPCNLWVRPVPLGQEFAFRWVLAPSPFHLAGTRVPALLCYTGEPAEPCAGASPARPSSSGPPSGPCALWGSFSEMAAAPNPPWPDPAGPRVSSRTAARRTQTQWSSGVPLEWQRERTRRSWSQSLPSSMMAFQKHLLQGLVEALSEGHRSGGWYMDVRIWPTRSSRHISFRTYAP